MTKNHNEDENRRRARISSQRHLKTDKILAEHFTRIETKKRKKTKKKK